MSETTLSADTLALALDRAEDELQSTKARLAELEAERTGTIHESWQHKTHAELLDGLRWQGAITKSLLAANDELQARLAVLRQYVSAQPCKCQYMGDGDTLQCGRCVALEDSATDREEVGRA